MDLRHAARGVLCRRGSGVGTLGPGCPLALTISPTKALWVVALFVNLNQIEGNLLQPWIMGRQIRVPPAMILVSILVLGTLLGPIIGSLLAIPAAVLVVTLVDHLTTNGSSRKVHETEVKNGAGDDPDKPEDVPATPFNA